jgi:Fe-S-cluster containining protein
MWESTAISASICLGSSPIVALRRILKLMDWIRRGLRFECQPDCGQCCTADVREGNVFLEPDDVVRLAEALALSARAFARRYTSSEYGELVLVMDDGGNCQFLKDGRCGVHEARPLQCRTYPFLPEDGFTPAESAYTWRREKKFCPGIGKGRLYRRDEIINISRGRQDVDGFDV